MGEYDHGITKLIWKGVVSLGTILLAWFRPDLLIAFFTFPLFGFRVYHVLWLLCIIILLKRLMPGMNRKVSSGKIFQRHYVKAGDPTPSKEEKLLAYTRKIDSGAVKSAFYWGIVIIGVGIAHRYGIWNQMWLIDMVMFFVFMDQFCVTVWCPFKWIVRNKCCKTCRINNWGYFMAFSPFIWIPSFWTWSILLLSVAVLVQWEFLFRKYPERFYEGYNSTLTCRNCRAECGRRRVQPATA